MNETSEITNRVGIISRNLRRMYCSIAHLIGTS
jgi:hypothetical protein